MFSFTESNVATLMIKCCAENEIFMSFVVIDGYLALKQFTPKLYKI